MESIIDAVYSMYLRRFKDTLKIIFPLCKNKKEEYSGGFNEANQTVGFINAAESILGFNNTIAWYELALPFNLNSDIVKFKNDERIDGVLILKDAKCILLVESKRYEGRSQKEKVEKIKESIDDALRIQCVLSNDQLLSHWLRLSIAELESYTKFGLILGAIWPLKNPTVNDVIYQSWRDHSLFQEVEGIYLGTEERLFTNNKECDDQWEFYLPGFFWQITEGNLFSTDMKSIVENRLCRGSIVSGTLSPLAEELLTALADPSIMVQERDTFLYLFPSIFVGSNIKGNHCNNKLWIYKTGNTRKLFAYPQPKRTIRLPDGFVNDGKYVSLCISSDSYIEDLKHVFDEIIRLNP